MVRVVSNVCHRFLGNLLSRENRTQEIDSYINKGRIPFDVDSSQHPEKSVEARACIIFPRLSSALAGLRFSNRAHGKGCRDHQRYQDCSGDVSQIRSHLFRLLTQENSVDELVNTAMEQISTINFFTVSRTKL